MHVSKLGIDFEFICRHQKPCLDIPKQNTITEKMQNGLKVSKLVLELSLPVTKLKMWEQGR